MATSTFLSLEQFTFIAVPPESQISSLRVNIYADGRLILNGKFAEVLSGKAVEIRFTDDARHLCFFESDSENAVKFPKNGSKRFPSAVEHLKKHKISLPAKYEVKFSEDLAFWQGDYGENPPVFSFLCSSRLLPQVLFSVLLYSGICMPSFITHYTLPHLFTYCYLLIRF